MKIIALILFLALPVSAWALPDRLSTTETSQSQTIKSTDGTVYLVNMSFFGVSTGRQIQLRDSATGIVRLTLVAGASAGKQTVQPGVGVYFPSGIYYKDNGQSPDSGTVWTGIQYF